jgi:hypothetical protein
VNLSGPILERCAARVLAGMCSVVSAAALCGGLPLRAAESWQSALASMPLTPAARELNRTNVAAVLLNSLRSNATLKALVLMPGATDEFYFFRRAEARLTNAAPSLLDAVRALTNQTNIRARFRPPALLLHTAEDPESPLVRIEDAPEARRIRERRFLSHFVFNDHDWDFVQPKLTLTLGRSPTGTTVFLPPPATTDSWHFFRHAVAGWNLDGWEALEAISLANKTVITIRRGRVLFEGDEREPGSSTPSKPAAK